jgi:NAD(P)-dependent dehydrogenase (short-subunit alcohol dehydrogenase family)
MADPVALVTGGSRGIGFAAAARLGRTGHSLFLIDNRRETLADAVVTLRNRGFRTKGIVGDVLTPADLIRGFHSAAQAGPVTAVVHAAGGPANSASVANIVRLNFGGTRNLLEEAVKALPPGAAVVVLSSIAGHLVSEQYRDAIGDPRDAAALARVESLTQDPQIAYGISKLAATELVRRRALDFGRRGVRVNTISTNVIDAASGVVDVEIGFAPDGADTGTIPHLPEPDHVAAAVEFLLGPSAASITGADLIVDGGCLIARRRDG